MAAKLAITETVDVVRPRSRWTPLQGFNQAPDVSVWPEQDRVAAKLVFIEMVDVVETTLALVTSSGF